MRRILFVAQDHHVSGGMEQWLHNFTFWLQSNTDWDVRVALPRGRRFNSPEAYLAAHPHLRPMILDVRVGSQSVRVARLVEAIHRFDPDLVVPIGTGDIFPAVAEAKRGGARVRLLQPVRALVPELFVNIVDYWPVVDGVVSISRLFQRFFEERLPRDRQRLHYVRHGARPAIEPHDDSRIRNGALPLRAGFVGRIEPEMKRVFDLVPFAGAVAASGASVELHVYGSGPAEEELRRRLAAAPLPAVFHGHQSQQQLYESAYPNLDVALLFSGAGEGTPNAICEALQNGVVPVISRYPGQAGEGFVIDGITGFTFATGDVALAASLVTHLAEDRRLLGELSERIRRRAAADTDVRMHRDWLRIFDATLSLPQKVSSDVPALSPARGRLDRLLGSVAADRLRALTRRYYAHADGWAEWPGTLTARPDRIIEVSAALARLDQPYTSEA